MSLLETIPSREEEASTTYVRRRHGEWTPTDQAAFEKRLANDPDFAAAYGRAEESVQRLSASADMPEMMRFREQAIAHARRSSIRRWAGESPVGRRWGIAASVAAAIGATAFAWQLSPWAYVPGSYRTAVAEQRMVELDDHSRIALDAATRIAVHYTPDSRTIELIEGQAQFTVAKDPARPFRVKAGDRTIVALGTVFTVEYTEKQVHVAMLEGRVAVLPQSTPEAKLPTASTQQKPAPKAIELSAGEEVRVTQDGQATVTPKADLEAATAWRNGKVIFRTERLGDAVQRMNRYSRVPIEVADPTLADEPISGVFEAGDTQGFISGVQLALPVIADDSNPDRIRLRAK